MTELLHCQEDEITVETFETVERLSRDMVKLGRCLTREEVKFVVGWYYTFQEFRINTANQLRTLNGLNKPPMTLTYMNTQVATIEKQIKRPLQAFAESSVAGRWALDVRGIGPIIAAGLIGFIDIERAPAVSNIFNYAGLNPKTEWLGRDKATNLVSEYSKKYSNPMELVTALSNQVNRQPATMWRLTLKYADPQADSPRAEKIKTSHIVRAFATMPWNAHFKVLCWKIGKSFQKFSTDPEKDYYGMIYRERKVYESEKNLKGDYSDQAKTKLEKNKIGKNTEAYSWYSKGMLPPGHIDARALRYAAKLFLSHLHEVMYFDRYGKRAPSPYAISHLGHKRYIPVPNFDFGDAERD